LANESKELSKLPQAEKNQAGVNPGQHRIEAFESSSGFPEIEKS
jgi:hypothetical protein